MAAYIDAEHINVDQLPGIWSPVQWDLTPEERVSEVETQASASLIQAVDVPEAILRLILDETAAERAYEPPKGFDPDQQGEWNPDLVTFQFSRPIRLERVERKTDSIYVEYNFGSLGQWAMEVTPEHLELQKI